MTNKQTSTERTTNVVHANTCWPGQRSWPRAPGEQTRSRARRAWDRVVACPALTWRHQKSPCIV